MSDDNYEYEYRPEYNDDCEDIEYLKKNSRNYSKCINYIQKVFPNEEENVQEKMALAVYKVANMFFDSIIPNILQKENTFSLN